MNRNLKIVLILLLLSLPLCVAYGQWTKVSTIASDSIYTFKSIGSQFFAGTDSGLYLSTDSAFHWKKIFKYNHVFALLCNSKMILIGTEIGAFLSIDNGKSWVAVLNGIKVNSLAAIDKDIIFAVSDSEIFRSLDYGLSWTDIQSSSLLDMKNILSIATSGPNLYIGTYYNYLQYHQIAYQSAVYHSIDNGDNWIKVTQANNYFPNAIAANGSSLYLGVEYGSDLGGISVTDDSGLTWKTLGLQNVLISGILVFNSNIFTLSSNGIYLSTDKGSSFVTINEYTKAMTFGLMGNYLYQGVYPGEVWRRPLSDFRISNVKNLPQSNLNISLSPNPTTGIITVHNAPANMMHVTITNVLGQTVSEVTNSGAADFTIDLSKLPPGTYFAKFSSEGEVVIRKIIRE